MHNFEAHISGKTPVLVDFYADWCGPCKLMSPILQEVKQQVGERANILTMDIEKNPSCASQFGIQSVPTVVIFKEGHIVWRRSGITPAHEILSHLALFIT